VILIDDVELFYIAGSFYRFAKAEISERVFDLFFGLINFLNLWTCLIECPIKLQSKLTLDPR
jgi:hypothetical protein